MHTILEPFNAVAARATFFLKLFPIKEWNNNSTILPSETIVHVEVLPNFGKDTYAIATSFRVMLIKVKKDITGVLLPSLAWEVYLRLGYAVASRVADYGHN